MLVYTHEDCLKHQATTGHPESPARLQSVLNALRELQNLDWQSAPLAIDAQLSLAHPIEHLQALEQRQSQVVDEPLALDADTWVGKKSLNAGKRAAGAICVAIDAVMQGPVRRAFCAVRPPGHHAERNTAMGFCFYSTVAIGALHAVKAHGLRRVAIIDFDVHQGNGTEDVIGGDSAIHYFASHQSPLYPFLDQHAPRPDNLHYRALPAGCDSQTFREVWAEQLLPRLEEYQPELMLISAGFDAHQADPLAQCQLQTSDFGWITEQLVAVSDRHAQGRVVSSLEGGYDLRALADSAVAHVQALSTDQAPA